MSKLYDWSEYLLSEFGLHVRFPMPGSYDRARGDCWCPTEQWRGLYFPGENLAFVRHELWGTLRGFQTLIHEFGHHLCYTGKLGYRDNHFVRRFWKEVPRDWLLGYKPQERQEEMIVECLASWAAKEARDNYLYGDLIGGAELDNSFAEFLISLGANPPPPL